MTMGTLLSAITRTTRTFLLRASSYRVLQSEAFPCYELWCRPCELLSILLCISVSHMGPSSRIDWQKKVRHGRFFQREVSSKPIVMVPTSTTVPEGQARSFNVKKYSDSVSLYTNPSNTIDSPASPPLLLFLPWLGSKAKSYEKYIHLYFNLGFDVLVAESSMSHFLWPRNGLKYAGQLLDLLMGEKELSSRKLYLHAMSIGGYTFAQMLVCSSKEQREMLEKLHGQVFDSLVVGSMEKMATGVARMVASPLLESLIVRGTLLYFSLLKAQTADYYEKGIRAFWDKPIHCPSLFFYCMNDPMSDYVTVEELLQDWENQGIKVHGKKWMNSVHAGHLKRHTEEYIETLNSFIGGLSSAIPRSKL
ncbi:transmembrane protein 53-A-like [Gastrophryne carolinensis]